MRGPRSFLPSARPPLPAELRGTALASPPTVMSPTKQHPPFLQCDPSCSDLSKLVVTFLRIINFLIHARPSAISLQHLW